MSYQLRDYQQKSVDLKEYFNSMFIYIAETGDIVWKERNDDSKESKMFNERYAGKIAGSKVSSSHSVTSYIQTKISGKSIKNHRIIFAMHYGFMPDEVDHIDHNGLNNRIENLRQSNRKDNSKNIPMQKSNKSGHIGVNWHKAAKKWQARAVDLNGKRIDLGRFDDIQDAINARRKYEKEFKYYENRDDINA